MLEDGEGRNSWGCLGGGGEGGAGGLARLGRVVGKVAEGGCVPEFQLWPPPNAEGLETGRGGFKSLRGGSWGATLEARSTVSKDRGYAYFGIITPFVSLLRRRHRIWAIRFAVALFLRTCPPLQNSFTFHLPGLQIYAERFVRWLSFQSYEFGHTAATICPLGTPAGLFGGAFRWRVLRASSRIFCGSS